MKVYKNSNKEEVIYPLMVKEIGQGQQEDPNLQALWRYFAMMTS